jgi:hypothetical protein
MQITHGYIQINCRYRTKTLLRKHTLTSPVLVSPLPELDRPVLDCGYGWLLSEVQESRMLGELINALGAEQISTPKGNYAKLMQDDNRLIYAD